MFSFTGQYGIMHEDSIGSDAGLYYMRARYYDPEVGRFISEDPIGFAGGDVNLYAYVSGNPINYVDPLGLWQYLGWKLLKNGGRKLIGKFSSKKAAVIARRQGVNIQARTKQAARALQKAASKGNPISKHKGHVLKNGAQGAAHYQAKGMVGHSFWSGIGAFTVDLFDPFAAEAVGRAEVPFATNELTEIISGAGNSLQSSNSGK